jgi:hypothetical protein
MPITYTPIATYTAPSTISDYTFTSIPATYTDLVIVVNGTMSASENSLAMRFNSDTTANYSTTAIYATGSSAASLRFTSDNKMYVGRMSSTNNSTSIFQIQNYSNTTTFKTVLSRGNSPSIVMETVSMWRSTGAVTSIYIADYGANSFLSGTTFTLYGIKSA